MNEAVIPNWESECKRLTVELSSQKERYESEIARLNETVKAREHGLSVANAEISIYRAKMEVIDLIFGKKHT